MNEVPLYTRLMPRQTDLHPKQKTTTSHVVNGSDCRAQLLVEESRVDPALNPTPQILSPKHQTNAEADCVARGGQLNSKP